MTPGLTPRPRKAGEPAVFRALAAQAGILDHYVDNDRRRRTTSARTRHELLSAMGYDVSSESAARLALEALEREAGRGLAPVCVVAERAARTVDAGVQERLAAGARIEAEWLLEDGSRLETAGSVRWLRGRRTSILLGDAPPAGYHRLRLQLDGREWLEQTRIVVPSRAYTTHERFGRSRVFGFVANLYAIRSAADWGVGDFGDLRTLVEQCAAAGGDFVGLNPLHALRNRGSDISPYSPVSRLFRSPLYLEIARVPELRESPDTQAMLESADVRPALARLRQQDHVEYDAASRLKQRVLDRLYATFAASARTGDSPRSRAFSAWLERTGPAALDFATFLALEAHFAETRTGTGWPAWPAAYHDPRSSAVREFRGAHEYEIRKHAWMQFELDRQLGEVAERAAECGLRIGIYGDLALSSAWNGADAWAFPGVFVPGVSLGAPPDEYSAIGQDWALPPLHPRRLAEDGYRYWRLLIRSALAHAGALRIDHIMGLFRQFWIPSGRTGDEGAYVRYPAEDLLGIVALESRRARAVIIGEDLGTVPRGLPAVLARWGLLSSRVLYFERDAAGRFHASRRYSKRALVTVNTHDHAPLAGFWSGRDLELRSQLGTLPPRDHAQAAARRERDKAALLRRLRAEALLPRSGTPDLSAIATAMHRFLSRTPSPLLGIAVDDLTAETEPVNVPGVSPERHPSWTRRSRLELERIPADPHAASIIGAVRDRSRKAPAGRARTRGGRPDSGR